MNAKHQMTSDEVSHSMIWYALLALLWVGTLFAQSGAVTSDDAYSRLQSANDQLSTQIQNRTAQINANRALLDSAGSPGTSSVQQMTIETVLLQQQNEADQRALDINRNSVDLTRPLGIDDNAFLMMMMSNQAQAMSGQTKSKNNKSGGTQAASQPNPAAQTLQVPDTQYDTSAKDDKTSYLQDLQNQLLDLTKAFQAPVSKDILPIDQSVNQEIADIKQGTQAEMTILKAAEVFTEQAAEARKKRKDKTTESIEDKLKKSSSNPANEGLAAAADAIAQLAVPAPGTYSSGSNSAPGFGGHMDTLTGRPKPTDTQVVTVRGSGASNSSP